MLPKKRRQECSSGKGNSIPKLNQLWRFGGSSSSKSAAVRTANGSSFVSCPICQAQIPLVLINDHIDRVCSAASSQVPLEEHDGRLTITVQAPMTELPATSASCTNSGMPSTSSASPHGESIPPVAKNHDDKDLPLPTEPEAGVLCCSHMCCITEGNNMPSPSSISPCGDSVPPQLRNPDNNDLPLPAEPEAWLPCCSQECYIRNSKKLDIGLALVQRELNNACEHSGKVQSQVNFESEASEGGFGVNGVSREDRLCEDDGEASLQTNTGELVLSSRSAKNGEKSETKVHHTLSLVKSLQAKQAAPAGHILVENFITEEEEEFIVHSLDTDTANPWLPSNFNGKHNGKAFGIVTDLYRRSTSQPRFPMPAFLTPVIARMAERVPALRSFRPNDANALEYLASCGSWLKPHVDDRQLSGELIVNLSMCGDCVMTYERDRGQRERFRVHLPRRSLQVLTGDSRYGFTHAIAAKDLLHERRVSITFRKSRLPIS